MLHKAGFLLSLLALMVDRSSALRQGYYTLVAPGSVRTNTPYHVSLSLDGLNTPALFNISLTDKSRLNIHKTVKVQPGTTELVSIPVPHLQFGYATLTVIGLKGIKSNKSATVFTEDHNYQIYIQTDKPRYRPGDLVRFRVICIDELTRPAVTDDVLDVLIYDDDSNLVKKVEDIKLTQGVFKGQMQLASRTSLGVWRIRVQSNSSQAEEKSFRVSSYVLPRVTLDTYGKTENQVNNKESSDQIWMLQATHLNQKRVGRSQLAKANSAFSLNILTPRPEVGKEMLVELTSRHPIDNCVYEIVSRGNIIQVERINVPKGATTHQLRINTTHAMVPKISLYVHRLKAGKLESVLKDIYVSRTFENSIEITVEGESRPGASVSVNVSTDEDSYVGLMAVDQRVLDNEMEEDLIKDRVFSRLTEFDANNLNEDVDPGSEAGLITFSNCFKTNKHNDEMDLGPMLERTIHDRSRVRRVFSEGWLFDDFESTPRGGLQLHTTIPDAITSWAITGFSLNPRTGLSLPKSAATLRFFESFFISMDLPSVVREGEILEVPIYVFNNNNEDALTEVTIECQSEHLVLLDSLSMDAPSSFNQAVSISVPAEGSVMTPFPIKPLKAGLFNVTVRATSPVGSDSLQKTLTVVAEGIPDLVTSTYLVHFLQESEQADELLVNIPENAVQGSEQIELSVVGDTFGPLVESLSNLVQVPYGNGKETTMYFISNLLVLKYLKVFNLRNPSLERRALVFLEMGYKTLQKLKHPNGSFSFFKRHTKATDDALQTAIVMWALQQARRFIKIDHHLLAVCKDFLKPKQGPNGGFQSVSGLDDEVLLTSFTLLALMEDEDNCTDVISRGLAFLYNSLDNLQSPTSAVLSKYVLVVGRHEKSQEILSQLSSRSARIRTGRRVLWDKPTTMQGILEATSSSFLSILQSQAKPTDTLIPIVTALLSPGHSDKVPTHLMALDVMIGVARDMHFGARDLHIHFESDQDDAGDLKVNSSNVHVLQTVQLNSAKVRLATKGHGLAVVTIKSTYNRPRENLTTSNFLTNITVSEGAEALVPLKVCVSTRVAGGAGNFTAVEVNLPSGYTVLEDQEGNPFNSQLGKYEAEKWFGTQAKGISPKLRAFKVDSGSGSVYAVFEEIDQLGACFDLSVLRAFRVLNTKGASVVVYDVYDESQRSTTLHQLDLTEETV